MQKANYLRGQITIKKGNVAKWTNIEDSYRNEGKETQADGAKKLLSKAIGELNEIRKRFSDLQFPDVNLKTLKRETVQCEGCGAQIAKGNTYCGECLCED